MASGGGGGKKRLGRPSALLIVDVQQDNVDPTRKSAAALANAGATATAAAAGAAPEQSQKQDVTLSAIRALQARVAFDAVIYTQAWHATEHASFLTSHLDTNPSASHEGVAIRLKGSGRTVTLTAPRCVAQTHGAQLCIEPQARDVIVKHGERGIMERGENNGGAFADIDPTTGEHRVTALARVLKQANVSDVYVCGFSLNRCVGDTAIAAAQAGYNTFLISDATKGVAEAQRSVLSGKGKETEGTTMHARLARAAVTLTASSEIASQAQDRRRDARNYLAKHGISELFEHLCAALLLEKPDNPRHFLAKELTAVQQQEKAGKQLPVCNFAEADLDALFTMMDPTGSSTLKGKTVRALISGLGFVVSDNKAQGAAGGADLVVPDSLAVDLSLFKVLVAKAGENRRGLSK